LRASNAGLTEICGFHLNRALDISHINDIRGRQRDPLRDFLSEIVTGEREMRQSA